MSKIQITNALIEDTNIKTNVQLVANTYMDITYDRLTKMLSLINAQLNQKLFRYYQKYPDRRIGFHCYHERVEGNTHSNIFLKIPPKQSHDLINIVLMIEDLWKQLGKRTKTRGAKFKLYQDYNVDDESRCTSYGRKENNYVPI